VPAERMKGKRGNRKEHLVPLIRQAAPSVSKEVRSV